MIRKPEGKRRGAALKQGLKDLLITVLILLLGAAALQATRSLLEQNASLSEQTIIADTGAERVTSDSESGNIEPGGIQGDETVLRSLQPASLFGMSVSLIGALLMGASLIALSRRKAQ